MWQTLKIDIIIFVQLIQREDARLDSSEYFGIN